MAKFVKLTNANGNYFYLNINLIEAFTGDENGSELLLTGNGNGNGNGEFYRVLETPEQILALLANSG